MLSRAGRRRLSMGLLTVLGLKKRGFFLPYRYAHGVRPPEGYPAMEAQFEDARDRFSSTLDEIEAQSPAIDALIAGHRGCRLDQAWFPRLDALSAYTMVRSREPARIVEVGSGHSTRFMASAIADGGLSTQLTCIDPAPRASLQGLDVTWRKATLQAAAGDDLAALQRGDVLFIDSSHLLMPGTDVDHLIGHILPGLPSGALLHVHDIFLPDAYPEAWACRGYNEQSAIAALLQGGGYRLLFASRYIATRMGDRLAENPHLAPARVLPGRDDLASSLWLEKY
ncbi:MAG: class I SAM-dependent methyltransferase [Alphaproteobacteria bacterium]|nr:class I SAM-dependent methyltransferase [Alphaproteobacteria bacterium]